MLQGAARHSMLSIYVMLFKQVLMLQGAARHSMLSICYVIQTGVTCCRVLPATLYCLCVMLFQQVLHPAGCCQPLYDVYMLCYSNRCYMLQGAARHSMLSMCYVIQTGITCCRVLPATLCCLCVMLFKQVLHAAGCCPPLYAVYVLCYSNRCYMLQGAARHSMLFMCYVIQTDITCCRVLPATLCCLYVTGLCSIS